MEHSRRKIGLALGSGAARGLAHIGVLEVLEKEGIPIDMIAGTSAGALIGALHCQGKTAGEIKKIAADLGWTRLLPLFDLALPRTGLISGRRITQWLRQFIGREARFSDLRIPLACLATDVTTGEEVVMSEGSVLEAVRASISIPGIFAVVKRGNRYLVDGTLTNAVPVSTLHDMGAELIIAVNVLPGVTPDDRPYPATRRGGKAAREPNIIEVLVQSFYIGVHCLVEVALKDADIVIEPEVAHIGPGDFGRAKELILRGELAALDAMPRLKRLLAAG